MFAWIDSSNFLFVTIVVVVVVVVVFKMAKPCYFEKLTVSNIHCYSLVYSLFQDVF